MKSFYAYVRVSTVKQGEKGSSLSEQRDAIVRYAQRHNLVITEWFEEMETAAKRGRRLFTRMLAALHKGRADGVILHKIDRGARNLWDWAGLQDLIDKGREVHFAHESLDLLTRGGRLSADIQAVVAADYIRNLRDEVRKGIYGRFKQGLYPLPAPIGYLDRGGGNLKEIDPVAGPLIRRAFENYATGSFSLDTLRDELTRLGLRGRSGRQISIDGLSGVLNNPFYIGLIHVKRTNSTFPGRHQPLIPKSLFDRVHDILRGKKHAQIQRHACLFRRLVTCKQCGYSLVGENQKAFVYYRCHTRTCPQKCVRQETIESALGTSFQTVRFNEDELSALQHMAGDFRAEWGTKQTELISAAKLALGQIAARSNRLTDAFVDRLIDSDAFEPRRTSLLLEQKTLEERLDRLMKDPKDICEELSTFLERAQSLWLSYELAIPESKREIVREVTSNIQVSEKNVVVALHSPFQEVANRHILSLGGPQRDEPRTDLRPLFDAITSCLIDRRFSALPASQ